MDDVEPFISRALARLRAAAPEAWHAAPDLDAHLIALARASDFAVETLLRRPELLLRLAADVDAPSEPVPDLQAGHSEQWPALLRRYRASESTRLVWRDVLGLDDVD